MKEGLRLKRLFTLIITVSLLFSTFSALAETDEYTITAPKDFTVWQSGKSMEDISAVFGMTEKELENHCDKNNIVYVAADSTNSKQITLSVTENEFSKTAVSFSRLSDKDLKEIATDFTDNSAAEIEIDTSADKNRFIKITETLADSGGQYTVTEYITVCSAKLYTLCISESGSEKQTALAKTVFNGYKIKDNAKPVTSGNNMLYTLLAVGGIAIFTALAVVLTYTVIRDIKRNKALNNEKENNG